METEIDRVPAAAGLPPYVASLYQQDGTALGPLAAEVQRLSLSENPYGPSPRAAAAAAAEVAVLNRYPDSSARLLRDTLAELHGVTLDRILVANGADELLHLVGHTFGGPEAVGLASACTYFGHEATLRLFGTEARLAPLGPDGLDLAPILSLLHDCDLALVCNPHNPTGTALPPADVEALAAAAVEADCVLVFDEAYAEFAEPSQWASGLDSIDDAPVIVLRTFSKAYGLAGLRCGYAIASPELIERLAVARHVTPFSVNRVALAAAREAARDRERLEQVVAETRIARATLAAALDSIGLLDYRSQTNFLLVSVPGGADRAAARLLTEHAVHARPCGLIGYPGHLRVGAPRAADADAVAASLVAVLSTAGEADA